MLSSDMVAPWHLGCQGMAWQGLISMGCSQELGCQAWPCFRLLNHFCCVQASVAGALARDILFDRVAPSTFALQAIVNHQRWATQSKPAQAVPDPSVLPDCLNPASCSAARSLQVTQDIKLLQQDVMPCRLATGGLAPAATNPGTSEVAVEADAAAEHHPAAAAPLPVMMEPAAPEGGSQQTAPLSPKAEPAMPPQQQVPESDQQTALPSPKVEPGMPHLQQQQQPVQQGATAAGTPAVKQEDPRAAMAAGDEGARISPLAPKQESQDVHGHGGLAAGAVTAAAACQGSGRPKAAEQLASAKQAAEVVDEDDEPEEEEEEESNVSFGSPCAGLCAVSRSLVAHTAALADERILMLRHWPGLGRTAPAGSQHCWEL